MVLSSHRPPTGPPSTGAARPTRGQEALPRTLTTTGRRVDDITAFQPEHSKAKRKAWGQQVKSHLQATGPKPVDEDTKKRRITLDAEIDTEGAEPAGDRRVSNTRRHSTSLMGCMK